MKKRYFIFLFFFVMFAVGFAKFEQSQPPTLLNVAYDVIRDFYKDYNAEFRNRYESEQQQPIRISQSHGGASKQALAVVNGLLADMVTLTQTNDIELLVQKGLVKSNWQQLLPNQSIPFGTVTVLLVKKGNPKQILDWHDLVRDDVQVIFANPKTSANGRFAYLSALAYAQEKAANPTQFMGKLLANVPILEAGARGATITFTQRGIGDVLIAPENEAALAEKALGDGNFEVVYPSLTAYSPVFVAEIDKNTIAHHTHLATQRYLQGLWSEEAQRLAAKNYFRPVNQTVLASFAKQFPTVRQFDVNEKFGHWTEINAQHFADGALFDQLYIHAQQQNKDSQ